jgi:3',5'-cyclic AMP phosphodiesterase CpdA
MSCLNNVRLRELLNKRLYGYLRWKLHRGAEHLDSILSALQLDINQTIPDHIAITGDLTHLSLPAEFQKAENWLRSIGSPSQVTVIPGNHDAYVKTDWDQTFACWTRYMLSDNNQLHDATATSLDSVFPALRVRGPIALISLCSAHPSAPYLAVGCIGSTQLQSLEAILSRTAEQRLFRVLLIHHPPAQGTVSWRKRLIDASALRTLLARHGAELILHGHAHRTAQSYLKTPSGSAPVMGAPSVSALGRTQERRARYYIYRIAKLPRGWDVKLSVRIYAPDEKRFILEHEQQMNSPR